MPGYELIGKEEFEQVKEVFDRGGVLFRHGFDAQRNNCYKVKELEEEFSAVFGIPHSLAVTSGTAALRVSLAALGVGVGDEVITQSFTFVATVESIIEAKAIPICTEIDDTLNMDPDDLEQKITARTKAVILVHMLGSPGRVDRIKEICRKNKIALIEDTAWGCGGKFQDCYLGTVGDVGTFSFDFAKTMTSGEGGMLVFKDEHTYKRAAAWHDHGHENNPELPRWEDSRSSSGFNYRMMELQGAVALAQLRKLQKIVNAQRRNFKLIYDALSDIKNLEHRNIPDGANGTADALIFYVDSASLARECREALLAADLATKILPEAYIWHFAGTWTHMEELVAAHGGSLEQSFPNSKELLSRAVSLPIQVNMDSTVPIRIAEVVKKVLIE